MINLQFPEGVTWTQTRRSSVFDSYGGEFKPTTTSNFYENSPATVIKVDYDTSNTTTMGYMFNNCQYLVAIPQFDTSNVTNMEAIFQSCKKITTIPQLDTSKVTNMYYMFCQCTALPHIPQLDTSKVTNMSNMFYNCTALVELPNFNCVKITNFGTSSYQSWLYGCTNLRKIGVIDCDSVTNVNYMLGNASRTGLKELGGFRNLGKASSVSGTNGSYFLAYAPNLTYESIINVLNGLYDRASAGLSVLTLKLHANHMAKLSDEDKAIATNKGWTLS